MDVEKLEPFYIAGRNVKWTTAVESSVTKVEATQMSTDGWMDKENVV